MCDAIAAEQFDRLPMTSMAPEKYAALRDQPGKPFGWPAAQTPVWRAYYNPAFDTECVYRDQCAGTPPRNRGQYGNLDNHYAATLISAEFGEVLVMRGKMPRTPATYQGNPTMPDGDDLRYWSVCNNESFTTTKAVDCLYDEEIPLDKDRNYTIVFSTPENRPANATAANGVAWLPYSPNGDGAGHLNDGRINLRNMLPSPSFAEAVQNTKLPGDEQAVMGAYLPQGTYMSKKEFEAMK